MKAAVFDGTQISIQEVPQPVPNRNQALIRVHAVGICGTDLAIVQGHLPTPTPLILGHEITGEVIEVGEDVDPQWIGKRVTPEINAHNCGQCYYCKRNMPTQCVTRQALGIDIDGGMAEYIVVDAYLLHEIPDEISYDQGTFIEPTAAAYQTFEMMPLTLEDHSLVVFGLGKLGLLLVQVACAKKLYVIVVDGSDTKLNLAEEFGAMTLINRLDVPDVPAAIRDLTGGIGADIVIDTTGNPDALQAVVASCRTRGKIHMKSTHGLATPLNITDIVVREITIYSSRCGPFDKAIDGIKFGEIQVDQLISKTFPLEQIQDAFASYEKDRDHIKTIVTIV